MEYNNETFLDNEHWLTLLIRMIMGALHYHNFLHYCKKGNKRFFPCPNLRVWTMENVYMHGYTLRLSSYFQTYKNIYILTASIETCKLCLRTFESRHFVGLFFTWIPADEP